jgi:hypothetical protein
MSMRNSRLHNSGFALTACRSRIFRLHQKINPAQSPVSVARPAPTGGDFQQVLAQAKQKRHVQGAKGAKMKFRVSGPGRAFRYRPAVSMPLLEFGGLAVLALAGMF